MRRLPFLTSKFAMAFMLGIILIPLGASLYLGYKSAGQMRQIVTEDFNQQQLELAEHTARLLVQNVDFIKRELGVLNLSASIQYLEQGIWATRMRITLSSVREEGVVEIRRINADGSRVSLVDERGLEHVLTGNFRESDFLQWAQQPEHKGRIYIQPVRTDIPNYIGRLIMVMAIPTYDETVDETHPKPSGQWSGVLAFYIDAHKLASKFAQDIRSGKTGYAWIMNEEGTFLYHPEQDFIGKNAFTVRKQRSPAISFDDINAIQREKMLAGQEGWGTYISGWHRGLTEKSGEINKLMAYAPARFANDTVVPAGTPAPFWSIAVVAPASEVQDVIHSLYRRQFLIQVIIGFMVLVGATFMLNYRYERQFTVVLEDEVERKKKELQLSEERYKALVENAADLIYTVDLDGHIQSINNFAARAFARTRSAGSLLRHFKSIDEVVPSDYIGLTFYDVMARKSADFHMEWLQDIKQTGRIRSKRHPVVIGDQERWFSTSIVGLKDDQGDIFAFEIISRDVTGRKAMEDRLINMEKLASIGTLAAGVAHEINNPIAVILGFNELLLEKTANNTEIHETLQIIEEEGLKCKKIVENLLTFARTPEKTQTATPDLSHMLEKTLAIAKNTLLTSKILLEADIAPDLPAVQGDPMELQQVFINLINNARDAMPAGGRLTVKATLAADGRRVAIDFIDNGVGIPREVQPKIFDPFFTTKKVGQGTGLGLSMCYGIIHKFGGNITFSSFPENEYPEKHGTTFTVLLPVISPGALPADSNAPAEEMPPAALGL